MKYTSLYYQYIDRSIKPNIIGTIKKKSYRLNGHYIIGTMWYIQKPVKANLNVSLVESLFLKNRHEFKF